MEYALSIQQTIDDGYIVAGYTKSNNGDLTGNNGEEDYWIVKLDELGNLQWQQNYGGSYEEVTNSIQQTADAGYIVAGWSYSNDGDALENKGLADYWILKLDELGILQWKKNYGGSGSDEAYSIQQTTDGGYIVGGSSKSDDGDVGENNGNWDYWILKIDHLGNLQWEQNYGGTALDYVYSIQQTNDGGYIVAGTSDSNDGIANENNDYWIIKLDDLGILQWEQYYGGSNSEAPTSIQQTIDGGYIVAGWSESNNGDVAGNKGKEDYWIAKLNELGNLEWEQNYGGVDVDWANAIQQTTDGGYIVAGSSKSNNGDIGANNGNYDYWIAKLGFIHNFVFLRIVYVPLV